jgi:hypothetical protein
MRRKKFTHGITFFVTAEMYQGIKKDTDELQISTSDLVRRLIEDYLYGTHSYCRPSLEEKKIEDTNTMEAK